MSPIKTYQIDTSSKPKKSHLLRNPLLFQGWGKKKNYFEGWYYKVVDVVHNLAFAVIPGISLNDDDPHCFIQVIDGVQCTSSYHRYDIDDFTSNNQDHYVKIRGNIFSKEELILELPDIKSRLKASVWNELPYKWYRPGIMGWYAYIPTMQCNHGLGSMDHLWTGQLTLNNQDINLSAAKGYVEKDWGSSFPKSWIWIQCNTFDTEANLSVFASVAHIPWMRHHFIGFLGAIFVDGVIEIFSTYTGAKRTTEIKGNRVIIVYKQKDSTLSIAATQAEGADLLSPISGTMRGKVNESLLARVEITYVSKDKSITATGRNAGMELAGDIDELMVN